MSKIGVLKIFALKMVYFSLFACGYELLRAIIVSTKKRFDRNFALSKQGRSDVFCRSGEQPKQYVHVLALVVSVLGRPNTAVSNGVSEQFAQLPIITYQREFSTCFRMS